MCTIMTATREVFDAHQADFLDQIYEDAEHNGHGFALVLAGERKDQVAVIRSLNIELIVAALTCSDWKRFWLHTRFATGQYRGLPGTHAFHARSEGVDWYVMHNGIIRHDEARQFNVDSEWIASMVRRYGVDAALFTTKANEAFANVFVVAPQAGQWYMLRSKTGSLYVSEDGQSYSTNKIEGVIEKVVPDSTWLVHEMKMADAPVVTRGSVYGNGSNYQTGSHGDHGKGRRGKSKGSDASATVVARTNEPAPPPVTTTTSTSDSGRATGRVNATLGYLANTSGRGNLGPDWIKTSRGVWVRQRGDVIYFNGTEPDVLKGRIS